MSLRVFELAKELNIPTKELIGRITNLEIPITGNFSSLTDEQITDIKKDLLQPVTRMKETVVATGEGPVKVKKRIISAKKAKESQKIKKSLKKDEAEQEAPIEDPKKKASEKKATKDKEPKKIIRKKAVEVDEAPVDEPKTTQESADSDKKSDGKETVEPKRKIKVIKKKPVTAAEDKQTDEDEKPKEKKTTSKTAEVKKEVESPAVETAKTETAKPTDKSQPKEQPKEKPVEKPGKDDLETAKEAKPDKKDGKKQSEVSGVEPETKKKEPVAPQEESKLVKSKDKKKPLILKLTETPGKEDAKKEEPDTKLVKPAAGIAKKLAKSLRIIQPEVDEELSKKAVKAQPKKDRFNKKAFTKELEGVADLDELEEEGIDVSRQLKFKQKKRPSRGSKRKDRNKKFKETNKEKHTFNPRQKDLVVGEFVTVGDLASLIGIKVPEIIKTLMSLGIMATITQSIDSETAVLVAAEHSVEIKVAFQSIEDSIEQIQDDESELQPRPPVVTIMGHVDHGKTSLLDKIRSTNVTGDEAGGITQHIGAYHVKTEDGYIAFLDTPGHEAFTAMRARGADVTDIVILVVAADDGPRPQTVEAIDHAKAANVEIIVAINKCDKPDANPDRTIQQLMEYELVPEEFGGDVPMIKVSAKSGDGIPKLMEMIHLQAEIMELKADPNRKAQGVVIESRLSKSRGNASTILIQTGTLFVGDNYVVGTEYGRVRAMWNDKGKKIESAAPSVPVEIVGLNGLPKAGDMFNVGEDEKQVRQIATLRSEKEKAKKQAQQQKRKLEHLIDSMGKDEKRILNLIVKTDVIGSLEALTDALNRLGNEQVAIRVIRGAVGAISNNDVLLAATSDAVIIGFNTRPDAMAKKLSVEENIDIRLYSVIYETIEDIRKALEGMLEPIVREEIQGKAEILEVFTIPKVGVIAGSKVVEGKIVRDCPIRVIRNNVIVHDGKLASLQRFKDAAKEVTEGFECGIGVESYKDLRAGDELESYLRLESAAKL